MLHIILSLDYEIYGEGSGSVFNDVINPANKILNICNRFGVPMNIMLEINEYQKFKQYDSELSSDLGYSPSLLIERQIAEAIKNGNEVQLHTHPQWSDAKYINKKWIIKDYLRSVLDLSVDNLRDFLFKSKKDLELLVRKYDPSYKCKAMRLTNLPWVEAPSEVVSVMKEMEIPLHSFSTSNSIKNNKKGFWTLGNNPNVYEVPVYSINKSRFQMLTPRRLYLYFKMLTNLDIGINIPKDGQVTSQKDNPLGFLFDTYPIKWDFCKQTFKEMLDFLNIAIKRHGSQQNFPLVMVGHTKDFLYPSDFLQFIKYVSTNSDMRKLVSFTTFSAFYSNFI